MDPGTKHLPLQLDLKDINLSLNVRKANELIVDYRKRRAVQAPINIDGTEVERVESFKFFGVHITNKLMVQIHQDSCEEGMTTHFPPQKTEKIWHGSPDPKKFYSSMVESILTDCITAWYGNCLTSDRKALQRVVRRAQYITGAKFPDIQNLYTRRCQRKGLKIVKDSSHPSHRLFSLLPHDKRYRNAKSRTKRLLNRRYRSIYIST